MEKLAPPTCWIPRPRVASIVASTELCLLLRLRCGNGLLTHILTAEGYAGVGIDLRARTSWSHYPSSTQVQLRVEALDPTTLEDPAAISSYPYLRPGIFIIGNHADELTPWVPVLATLCTASGYMSIPCCAWAFDTRYQRTGADAYPIPDGFADTLNLGGDGGNKSSYSSYRIWLASLSLHLGWRVECEMLRIPSTRNWAIIGLYVLFRCCADMLTGYQGRAPVSTEVIESAPCKKRAKEIVQSIRERAVFRTRVPEGRGGVNH